MMVTVPGYTAVTNEAATSDIASVAERMIGGNMSIPNFEWQPGNCVACGSSTHWHQKPGPKDIACLNPNCPGAKENAAKKLCQDAS